MIFFRKKKGWLWDTLIFILIMGHFLLLNGCRKESTQSTHTGSVIFIHPDGSSLSAWCALRLLKKGPDGLIHWDKMERMGVYRGHLKDSPVSSSQGGATAHAYGIKAHYRDYGNNPDHPFLSLSGKAYSIAVEAQKAGKSLALINSGHLCEPGTGAFVANSEGRGDKDLITRQIIESGADIILAGGEELLLPPEVLGRHGKPGTRKDGKNLIQHAENLGYTVVYTRNELLSLPDSTEKVFGVFASYHTFNDKTEEKLKKRGFPLYNETAPTVAEMLEVALRIFQFKGKDFLIVVEEEGSDNFANQNNAIGTFEALNRADDAIGVALEYIEKNPHTLLITAADSDAGGMEVLNVLDPNEFDKPLPPTTKNGAPLDGRDGTATPPFVSAPDRFGNQFRFGIAWTCYDDVAGGVLARAHGLNSHLLPNNVDNTDIYRMMYITLFGEWLSGPGS
ncbi:MAG: alkaline phosphatase [Calditrichia bacterium]